MAWRIPRTIAGGLIAICAGAAAPVGSVWGEEQAAIPDFSGRWGRNAFDHEHMPSGPVPLTNLNRRDGDTAHPVVGGDPIPLLGDYNNPILKPEAAAIVKKIGEIFQAGLISADPSNQCAPYQPPYAFSIQLGLEMLQTKDGIVMLFPQDDQVRHIRLNSKHPDKVTPSAMGDAIGWYEGDTLVVDTVGVKVLPVSMLDRYGTPFSEEYASCRALSPDRRRRSESRHGPARAARGPRRRCRRASFRSTPITRKALQVEFTVDDPEILHHAVDSARHLPPQSACLGRNRCAPRTSSSIGPA